MPETVIDLHFLDDFLHFCGVIIRTIGRVLGPDVLKLFETEWAPFHGLGFSSSSSSSSADTPTATTTSSSSSLVVLFVLITFLTGLITTLGPAVRRLYLWTPSRMLTLIILCTGLTGNLSFALASLVAVPFWRVSSVLLLGSKFLKDVVHLVVYACHRGPVRKANGEGRLSAADATVVISATEFGERFVECVTAVLANRPAQVLVVTIGNTKLAAARSVCLAISSQIRCFAVPVPGSNFRIQGSSQSAVQTGPVASPMRSQLTLAISQVRTRITIITSQSALWPPDFLPTALAPFSDPRVSQIGIPCRVRREHHNTFAASRTDTRPFHAVMSSDLSNYMSCIFDARYTFLNTAANTIDGGIGGAGVARGTSLLRTAVIQDPAFMVQFLDENWRWVWNWCRWLQTPPLGVDISGFFSRYMAKNGFRTVFLNDPALEVQTLGVSDWRLFHEVLYRQKGAEWRGSFRALFEDQEVWKSQWWSTYGVYLVSLFESGWVLDAMLVYSLSQSGWSSWGLKLAILYVISGSGEVLIHLRREPGDFVWVPFGIGFAVWEKIAGFWVMMSVGVVGLNENRNLYARLRRQEGETPIQPTEPIGSRDTVFNIGNDGSVGSDGSVSEEERLQNLLSQTRNLGVRANEQIFELQRQLARLRISRNQGTGKPWT